MNEWQTRLKMGMTAILLLSSVSCMRNSFHPLNSSVDIPKVQPAQSETPAPQDMPIPQTTPPEAGWKSAPEDFKTPAEPEAKDDSSQNGDGDKPNRENETEKENKAESENKTEKENKGNKSAGKDKPAANDNSADFTGPGVLKPTIYYFPTFNEDESKCEKNTMMHAAGGKDLLMACEKTAMQCGQQGSCAIIQNGVTRSFNILNAKGTQDRFFEIAEGGCKYGFGVQDSCLDPFYTLAADLTIYKPGQVIFVPAIVGMELPDGSKHSGYFVIRDRGRGVEGAGRFDFFSGTVAWLNPKNPFTKLGLGDVKTNIPYFKVKGKTAQQVLNHRAFPKLPIR